MSKRAIARLLPLMLGALLVLRLSATWAARMPYPFDLEWMEGGMLVHAWRLEQGLSLYPPPGRDFIPYIYPPGYASVLAVLGWIAPLGHPLGRAVSLAGTLAAALASERIVRVHTGDRVLGWVAAATFLGCYPFSGAFYDLVRLDGLAMGLLAWAIALGAERRRGSVEAAALLLVAAFFVKQHAALIGLPMWIGIARREGWREGLRFALMALVPALTITGFLHWRTGGTYLTYVLAVPSGHGFVGSRILPGTPRELALALPVALPVVGAWVASRAPSAWRWRLVGAVLALALLGAWWFDGRPREQATALLGFVGLGLCAVGLPWLKRASWQEVYGVGVAVVTVVAAASMRGHVGGFVNVHIPLHWAVATGFGVALARSSGSLPRVAVGSLLAVVQLLWLAGRVDARLDPLGDHFAEAGWQDPLVPTAEDREAGEAVVEALRGRPGPILSPYNPWLAVQAGHTPGLHLIALWDVDHKRGPFRAGAADVREAVDEGYWGTIVDGSRAMRYGTEKAYRRDLQLPTQTAFAPRTGWPAKPAWLLVPQGQADEP